MYRPIKGASNIPIGNDPRMAPAKGPIPGLSTILADATKTTYGNDPKIPVQIITVPKLRPRVGPGDRIFLLEASETAKQAADTHTSISASCVVFIRKGSDRCRHK